MLWIFLFIFSRLCSGEIAGNSDGVDLKTGRFGHRNTDLIVRAAEPIPLSRGIAHRSKSALFFPHLTCALVYDGKRVEYQAAEPDGRLVRYRQEKENIYFPLPEGGAEPDLLSVRENPFYNRLILDGRFKIRIDLPNGGYRFYKRKSVSEKEYFLHWEKLPNGHHRNYEYDKYGRVKKVFSRSPDGRTAYAFIQFDYANRNRIFVTASDGQRADYTVEKEGDELYYLVSLSSPDCPSATFAFEKTKGGARRLCQLFASNTRLLDLEYAQGRVVKLKRPNRAGTLVPVRTFSYTAGFTDTLDAEGILTRSYFDADSRLGKVEYYQRQGQLHSTQTFRWEGIRLVEKALFDAGGACVYRRQFSYDPQGNIREDRFEDGITGVVHAKRYRYSPDAFHLPIEEEDDTGLLIKTEYVPGTDLIKKKLFSGPGGIFKRYFYLYDSHYLLTAEIIDDGTAEELGDLTGISERKIQRIERSKGHFLPEEIADFYWDGKEILLAKRRLYYNERKQVVREDYYDAKGAFLYASSIAYDRQGHRIRTTDPIGRESVYQYDSLERLVEFQEAASPFRYRHIYDAAGDRTAVEKRLANGQILVESTLYDAKGNPSASADAYGRSSQSKFDPFGHCVQTEMPLLVDEEGQPYSPLIQNRFDVQGHLIETKSASGSLLKMVCNATGEPHITIHPDGTKTSSTYFPHRTRAQTLLSDGTSVRFAYDLQQRMTRKETYSPEGSLLATESWTYNAFHLLSHTDGEGKTTRYLYDKAGRKAAEYAFDRSLVFSYDDRGHLAAVRDTVTEVSHHFLFDAAGRTVDEWIEESDGAIEQRIQYEYTPFDQIAKVIRQGAIDQIFYDGQGRKIEHIDPLGVSTRIVYRDDFINDLGQKVLLKTTIAPNGVATLETHDALNRVVKIERRDPQGTPLHIQEIFYDREGNKARLDTLVYARGIPVRTLSTRREYDAMHRLIRETEGGKRTTRFIYNERGQKTAVEKPDGVSLFFQSDALGRLLEIRSSDGSIHYIYEYRSSGMKPVSIRDCIHNTLHTCRYDAAGRLIQETNGCGLSLSWTYDEAGRLASICLPDQSAISYRYRGSHLTHIERPAYSHLYAKFDAHGLCIEEHLPFDLGSSLFTFDPLERLISSTSPWHEQRQQFNSLGEVASVSSSLFGGCDFSYDFLSQLIREGEEQYEFDSIGNPTSMPVDELNQLQQLELAYDLNGHLVRKGETLFRYDALDRLIAIQTPTNSVHYTYDPFHRLISKSAAGKTLFFFHDGEREMGAVDDTGRLVQLKVLGPASSQAIALECEGQTYIPLHDLRRNLIALASPSKRSLVETYPMRAFGPNESTPSLSPWRFSSKRHEEAGLIYFGARFYDPSLKRWLTPDPLGSFDGPNRYVYVLNNPVNRLDRWGLHQDPLFARNYFEDFPVIYPPSPINPRLIFQSKSVGEALAHMGLIHPHLIVYGEKVHHLASSPTSSFAAKLEELHAMYTQISLEEGRRIVDHSVTNGINVSRSDFETYVKTASQKFHHGVFTIGKYNPSQGILNDIRRLNDEKDFGCETPAVIDMRIEIAVKATLCGLLDPRALSVKELHSEAGTQYCLAFRGLPEEQKNLVRQHILVMALGPTTAVPMDYAFQAVNIYSEKDKTLRFSQDMLGHPNYDIRIVECLTPKENWTSFAGDHGYLSETYQKAREEIIKEYERDFGYLRFRRGR